MENILDHVQDRSERSISLSLVLPVLGLAVGVISYGPWWWTIGLSIAFPVLLFRAETRTQAFLIALLYHLGASRALALAAGSFYGNDIFFGVTIWALGNVINALIYGVLWQPNLNIRLFTIPLATVLTALPPFGVIGWANPITAAGVLFPGAGVIGFAYLLGFYASLAMNQRAFQKIFILLMVWSLFTAKTPKNISVEGISTSFSQTDDGGKKDYDRQVTLIEKARKTKGKILLLPEAIVTGGFTKAGVRLWEKESRPIILGVQTEGLEPENLMMEIKSGAVYHQRQPIPFSMWKPFIDGSFKAFWFENPTMNIKGQKFAPLICYEGFLVWPIVHSYLSGGKAIIATGNYWWAGPDEIPVIHHSIVKVWSRLFSMPYAMAVNL